MVLIRTDTCPDWGPGLRAPTPHDSPGFFSHKRFRGPKRTPVRRQIQRQKPSDRERARDVGATHARDDQTRSTATKVLRRRVAYEVCGFRSGDV